MPAAIIQVLHMHALKARPEETVTTATAHLLAHVSQVEQMAVTVLQKLHMVEKAGKTTNLRSLDHKTN